MTTETLSEIHVSYKPGLISSRNISNSQDAFEILNMLFSPDTISLQEQFVVLYLNRANKAIGTNQLSQVHEPGTKRISYF